MGIGVQGSDAYKGITDYNVSYGFKSSSLYQAYNMRFLRAVLGALGHRLKLPPCRTDRLMLSLGETWNVNTSETGTAPAIGKYPLCT